MNEALLCNQHTKLGVKGINMHPVSSGNGFSRDYRGFMSCTELKFLYFGTINFYCVRNGPTNKDF